MSTTRLAVSAALASGLLLVGCSDQKKEIAAPPNLRGTLNAAQSGVCPTSIDPNDTSCLKSTSASFSSAPGDPGATSNGSLKIAYINDSDDQLGLQSVQSVVAAAALGTVEHLTIQQVLDGALDNGGYDVVFNGRHWFGPSVVNDPGFTRVPVGLREAIDRALAAGVGFISEYQGGSPVWTTIGPEVVQGVMTEPNGDLWKWYQGTVDRGDCSWIEPDCTPPTSFTTVVATHPVMQGLDATFQIPSVEFCFRVQNPDGRLQVLAKFSDNGGSPRPAILAGTRSNARVVLWPCDWGDNVAMDNNVKKWIENAIRWAAEGAANETEQEVPAGQAATVTVKEDGKGVAGIDALENTFVDDDGTTPVDVIVKVRLEKLDEGETCHAYLIGQTKECLEITATKKADGKPAKISDKLGPNERPIVGVCRPTGTENVDIFKWERPDGTDRAVALREANAKITRDGQTFLDCEGYQSSASVAPSNWLQGFAMGVAKRVGRWISPKPLYAVDKGFGGFVDDDHLSFFTWASPMPVSGAALAADVGDPGKDVYSFWGALELDEPKDFEPGQGEMGFDPALHDVLVAFGLREHTVLKTCFTWSVLLKAWVCAAKASGSGITLVQINPANGKYFVAGVTTPSEGAGDHHTHRSVNLRFGKREWGAHLHCGTDQSKYKCVLQHEH
jgi:hypothetical protein